MSARTLACLLAWLAPPACADELLRVGLADGCQLQAQVRRDERPACWRLRCPGHAPRTLVCDASALHQLVQAIPSADQRWLAVLSVGEGHPWLELVDLPALRERGQWRQRCELNPWPGNVSGDAWYGARLGVYSDIDPRAGADTRIEAAGGAMRRWLLDPADCALAKR